MVIIGLPLGHPLATLGGIEWTQNRKTPHTKMALFVDHPGQVMRMIREAKDKVGQQQVIPGIAVDYNPNPSPKPNA
eukprot:scaffold11234_cov57-Phaeocystis_antarctica.AAC.1